QSLSREEWNAARELPDSNPLKAFAGFGCSFGGKWFDGYARSHGRNYADENGRACVRRVSALRAAGCSLHCIDFLSVEPFDFGGVLYLDPPYRGVTGYSLPFDHDAFDRRVHAWSRIVPVFVSEYALPYGREVWENAQRGGMDHRA